jgi:flagellar assembly protein FliH
MLIKKNKLPKPSQPHAKPKQQHEEDLSMEQAVEQPAVEAVEYTEDAVASGDLPERRSPTNDLSDRRRGYRRIEDRHLISKAHEEARYIKEQAYEEGLELGLLRVKDELKQLRKQFAQTLTSRVEAMADLTDDIAPIAVEIAERLIKVELSCDEDLVNTIVEDTLQKLDRNSKTVLIKVNPQDKARVKAYIAEHPPTHLKAEVIIIDQPDVDAGGCIVETDSGLIDASFHTRLTILKELFGAYQPPEEKPRVFEEAMNDQPEPSIDEAITPEGGPLAEDAFTEGGTHREMSLEQTEPTRTEDHTLMSNFDDDDWGDEYTQE